MAGNDFLATYNISDFRLDKPVKIKTAKNKIKLSLQIDKKIFDGSLFMSNKYHIRNIWINADVQNKSANKNIKNSQNASLKHITYYFSCRKHDFLVPVTLIPLIFGNFTILVTKK